MTNQISRHLPNFEKRLQTGESVFGFPENRAKSMELERGIGPLAALNRDYHMCSTVADERTSTLALASKRMTTDDSETSRNEAAQSSANKQDSDRLHI